MQVPKEQFIYVGGPTRLAQLVKLHCKQSCSESITALLK
jgi:hypothetical protein